MTNEEREVAETLGGFANRIDEILLLIQEPHSLSKEDKARAQELLRTLKEDMNGLHRSLDTARARATMNAAEQACLAPTIHEASATMASGWQQDKNQRPPMSTCPEGPSRHCAYGLRRYDVGCGDRSDGRLE